MSVDSVIRSSLASLSEVVVPNKYDGELKNYIVYNYTSIPDVFAESEPDVMHYYCQVHWFLPHKENPNAKKKQICQALHGAGFTYPSITNASESSCQHYIFECQYCDGEV